MHGAAERTPTQAAQKGHCSIPHLHICTKGNSHALNWGIYCLWVSLVPSCISYSFGKPLYEKKNTFCSTNSMKLNATVPRRKVNHQSYFQVRLQSQPRNNQLTMKGRTDNNTKIKLAQHPIKNFNVSRQINSTIHFLTISDK